MLLKKVVRLFGFIIGAPFVVILIIGLWDTFTSGFTFASLSLTDLLEIICSLAFIFGYLISFSDQIIGGIMVFLSPLTQIGIASIKTASFQFTTTTILMLVAATFLLFTAEKEH